MAGTVTFEAEDNGGSIDFNLFGPEKNRVKVDNMLKYFYLEVAVVGRTMLEARDDGLSVNTFEEGKLISLLIHLLLDLLQNLLPLQVRRSSSKFNNKMIAMSVLVRVVTRTITDGRTDGRMIG
jgi:hypothetical protein